MEPLNQAASLLGQCSAEAEARKKMWGMREFVKRMREWDKQRCRPKRSETKQPKKGGN